MGSNLIYSTQNQVMLKPQSAFSNDAQLPMAT